MQPNTDANIAAGQQRCINCPGGTVSDGTLPNGACLPCASFANEVQTQCVPTENCKTTARLPNQCVSCPPGQGTADPAMNNQACVPCPPGTFSSTDGFTCVAATVCRSNGLATLGGGCFACRAGEIPSLEATPTCVACDAPGSITTVKSKDGLSCLVSCPPGQIPGTGSAANTCI